MLMKNSALLLFQGDSITDADRLRNDPAHLGHGYAAMVAGVLSALYPEKGLRFLNRGIAGNRVSHLVDRWAWDTLALKPDVLCLLIGANDSHLAVADPDAAPSLADWEKNYRWLLESAKAKNPGLRLVVLEPFLVPSGDESAAWCEGWRPDLMRRIPIIREAARAAGARYVPLDGMFAAACCKDMPPEAFAPDGVHPTEDGHRLIARGVLEALR